MKSEAVIYLSEQRGSTQSQVHRSYHSFNFGSFQRADRRPFKNLIAFNDEVLLPGGNIRYSIPSDHQIFFLPVVGGLAYKLDDEDKPHFIDVGQSEVLSFKSQSALTISNVYQGESISFICCWFLVDRTIDSSSTTFTFDLDGSKNELLTILTAQHIKGYIGKFAGRNEGNLKLKKKKGAAFAFVLEGAFELQNRLLQQKDGLSMRNVSELEFEALSNDAILLIFEL